MDDQPLAVLERWERQGGVWRARSIDEDEAIVDFCTCTGERVDELRSADPDLLSYLRARPRSDAD
ncbi:MAG: hypothetical protein ACJ76V_06145 [Thermoleophilaceae bacterium]